MRWPLRYVNSRGESVDFSGEAGPYHYGKSDLFDFSLETKTTGGRIRGFSAGMREYELFVFMVGGSLAERDRFIDIVSYDTRLAAPGTLYAGSSRLSCYFLSVKPSNYALYESRADFECVVVTDRPVWVRSVTQSLAVKKSDDEDGLGYPHGYPHGYGFDSGSSDVVVNPFQLPAKADIAFGGPCSSPYINIAGNRYQVNERIDRGQLIIVRGFGDAPSIVMRSRDGTERSILAKGVRKRKENAHVFAEVPVGRCPANWGAYPVEVTLYEERYTPSWQGL